MKNLIISVPVFLMLIFSFSCVSGKVKGERIADQNPSQSQYGEQGEFKEFLSDFTKGVESGNWDYVLSFFDSENFMLQASIGVGEHQYLIEGMELPSDEFIDEDNFLNIDRLKSLVVKKIIYGVDDYYAEVSGEALLKTGHKVPFYLRIKRNSDGSFFISPPLG